LLKLEAYGIKGSIHLWLKNFLSNRHMSVVLDGECSNSVTVDSGVPQGTVLGPLLFLCHINDLPDCVKSQVRLFADDCLLYRTIKNQNDHAILQNDLRELELWATQWGMSFNAKKCYIMSINNSSNYLYDLNNHVLERVQCSPYLGLTISDDLKWGTHITKISNKANSVLGFLKRNLKYCPQSCKHLAYIALVRSTLEYGSVIWDPYLSQDINKIESIQRRAARFITRDYRSRDPGCMTAMLKNLNLPSLQQRRQTNRLKLFYKISNSLVPGLPVENFLVPAKQKRHIKLTNFENYESQNINMYRAQNNNFCYQIPFCKTENFKHSFFVKTTAEWNQLPNDVANATSLDSFTAGLISHFD